MQYDPSDDDWAKWDEGADEYFDDEVNDRYYWWNLRKPNIVYILVDDWGLLFGSQYGSKCFFMYVKCFMQVGMMSVFITLRL